MKRMLRVWKAYVCEGERGCFMPIVHLTVLTADNYFFSSPPFPRAPARVVVRQDNIIII